MLDIAFYSQDREEAEAIEVSNDFYEWLARSIAGLTWTRGYLSTRNLKLPL